MSEHFSLQGLVEMCGDDQEFINEMIQVFVDNNAKYLEAMTSAVKDQNWMEVKSNAHKIKPSVLLMRIKAIEQDILDLNEFAGKEINLDKIPEISERVENELQEVFDEMKKKISEKLIYFLVRVENVLHSPRRSLIRS